jgi:hypothetical protein
MSEMTLFSSPRGTTANDSFARAHLVDLPENHLVLFV